MMPSAGGLAGGLSSDAYVEKYLRGIDAEHYSAAGIVPYRKKDGAIELLLPKEKPWNSFTQAYDPIGWNAFCGKRVPRQERNAETTAVRCFLECVGEVEGAPTTESLYGMMQNSFMTWYPAGKFGLILIEVQDGSLDTLPERYETNRTAQGTPEEFRILPMGIKKWTKQIEALEWVNAEQLVPEAKGVVCDLLGNILQISGFREFLEGKLDPEKAFVSDGTAPPVAPAFPKGGSDGKDGKGGKGGKGGWGKGGGGGWGKGGGGWGKGKGGAQKGWKGQGKGMAMYQMQGPPMPMGPMAPMPGGPMMAGGGNPAEMQRQMYGEQLYLMVQPLSPSPYLAQKITGMLLELPNNELLLNLTNQEELHRRVSEALEVLREDGVVG